MGEKNAFCVRLCIKCQSKRGGASVNQGGGARGSSPTRLRQPPTVATPCRTQPPASPAPHLPQVESFGTGRHIKLPGPTADAPNVYQFGQVRHRQRFLA